MIMDQEFTSNQQSTEWTAYDELNPKQEKTQHLHMR